MGRISLQRLLTTGLISILFLSFLLSAAGVAVMVRGYLWRRGAHELEITAGQVRRFLLSHVQEDPGYRGPKRTRLKRLQGFVARGGHRASQGRGEIFLLKGTEVKLGPEGVEGDWNAHFAQMQDGLSLVENDGLRWQIYAQALLDPDFDRVVIVRQWSGSMGIVRILIGYQALIMTLVLLLAALAVRFLAARIAVPLAELKRWSNLIGEGQPDELKRSNIKEIGDLQISFSQMGVRVEEALEAHRRFVADASHELKTPLTAISGMLELLQSHPEMNLDDRSQALEVAKNEAGRMDTLISNLLVLSRAQAKRSGEKQEYVLAAIIDEQIAVLGLLYPEQAFDVLLDRDICWKVNSEAFGRIVRNLVENAAKYAGGKPIDIELKVESGEVRLKVSDRGPGIEPEKLPHLFQRFYRMDEGRARSAGGFGLGLAIVKALVEELGGELTAESTVDVGTSFLVQLKKS